MQIFPTDIPDVKLFLPEVFTDERGTFFESFNLWKFAKATGLFAAFIQDNHAISTKGVLRGLHYQAQPHPQGKLVRVTKGAIFDVAVDLRLSSRTFGKWVGHILSEENRLQMWIPEGFAHGYLTLTDTAECHYKVTRMYNPRSEHCIAWNDPTLDIQWPGDLTLILSEKDKAGLLFGETPFFN